MRAGTGNGTVRAEMKQPSASKWVWSEGEPGWARLPYLLARARTGYESDQIGLQYSLTRTRFGVESRPTGGTVSSPPLGFRSIWNLTKVRVGAGQARQGGSTFWHKSGLGVDQVGVVGSHSD